MTDCPPVVCGNLRDKVRFTGNPAAFLLDYGTKYDVTRMQLPVFNLGTTEYTVVSTPDIAADVLRDTERFEQYSDIGAAMPFENPLSSPAEDDIPWKEKREAYVEAFSGRSYRDAITAAETQVAEDITELDTGTWYETTTLMRRLTMRMVSTILFDQTPPAEVATHFWTAVDHALHVTNLDRSSFSPVWMPRPSLLRVWMQRDPIMTWVDEAITSAPDDALIWEIADTLGIHEYDTRLGGIALFPLVAGFVSPEVMLSICFDRLGTTPAVKAEIEQAAMGLPRSPSNVDLVGIRETFRWSLFESLRLFPPTFFVTRRATQATTLGGYTVSQGDRVWIDQWSIGRHPDYWENPQSFTPERWTDRSPQRDAFIPFGVGARDCLGSDLALLEGELILANLFREFDVEIRPQNLTPTDIVGGMSLEFPSPEIRLHK